MHTKADSVPAPAGNLWNPDLAPVPTARRTWGIYNYAALWTTFSINIATYLVASGLIAGGMNWKQAIFTIALGHLIILVPILLNAHAGAKFGVPFPVYSRAAFGVLGANVPAVLRALVACGWFGIQTWVGGTAINAVFGALIPAWKGVASGPMICFIGFWALNLAVTLRGIETIRLLQGISAPFLTAISLVLLVWAWTKAGSFDAMLSAPSRFKTSGEFYAFFVPSLTGVVAHWAAIALNISDFTRYATSQRAQLLGQAVSLPITMTVYSFIAIAVTTATVVIFGEPIWDPVAVIARFGSPLAVAAAAFALVLATLNVNVAANIVSPANDFSNLSPKRISFKMGGVITCLIGLFMQPWRLLATHGSFIIGWLVGYSSFLGPVAGVLIADYFVVRRTELDVDDLYRRGGRYEYSRGVNTHAVVALVVGIVCALAGLLAKPAASAADASPLVHALAATYDYAWFIGFAVSFALYLVLMRGQRSRVLVAIGAVAALLFAPSAAFAQEAPAESNAPGLTSKFVDVTALGGVIKTRYYEAGSGEAMVLAHGGGWAGYYSANTWSQNIPGLAKRFHVFAPDKLASGMTDNPPSDKDYNIQGEVEHMYQFITQLNGGPVHLVGQSRGGGLALLLTVAHPEIVKTLVIVDSLTISPDVGNAGQHEALMAQCPKERDASWKCEMRMLSFNGELAFPDDSFAPGLYMGHLPKSQLTMQKITAGAGEPLASQFPQFKQAMLDRLKTEHILDMPILLYWAANDPQAPALKNGVAVYDILRQKHPQTRMIVVSNAGHFHYREYPDEFNHNVIDFIDFWSAHPQGR